MHLQYRLHLIALNRASNSYSIHQSVYILPLDVFTCVLSCCLLVQGLLIAILHPLNISTNSSQKRSLQWCRPKNLCNFNVQIVLSLSLKIEVGMILMSLCDAGSVPLFFFCHEQHLSSVQPAQLQIPSHKKSDCAFGKRIQLEPMEEIQ